MDCSSLPNLIGVNVIDDIDFYNLEDTIYDRVFPLLIRVPKYTSIFIHTDIGLAHDVCGLAISYFSGEIYDNDGFDKTPYPTFTVPLVIGISRKKGQQTSLDHIFQFIQRLSVDYSVHVSADSFASAGLFQSCERAGIEHMAVSVDKTTEPYFMFKAVDKTLALEVASISANLSLTSSTDTPIASAKSLVSSPKAFNCLLPALPVSAIV